MTHRPAHILLPFFAAILLLPHLTTRSQPIPQNYFRSPVDFDITLSASFAEFRSNHFHGGIDIRTGGVTGKPVYAVADGYVARVSISAWGGGKILYIKHPNGLTSVYMHLDSYAGEIGRQVKAEQYAQQKYSISRIFRPDEIPVKKGQIVAYSGNTGSSGGPHLHFELRQSSEDDQHTHSFTFNPLHSDIRYTDVIRPTIRGIRLYPLSGVPRQLGSEQEVSINSPFFIGIYATDAAEGSTARNGVDRIEIEIDGKPVFRYTTDGYLTDSTRVVNALIDYRHYRRTGQPYLLTRALPGAKGKWIPLQINDGIYSFAPNSKHKIRVRVFDVKNNSSERTFVVNTPSTKASPKSSPLPEIRRDAPFSLSKGNIKISLPPFCLYADETLKITSSTKEGYLSEVFSVEPTLNDIPPHLPYTISLRPKGSPVVDRAVIIRIDGNKRLPLPTRADGGFYTAEARDFGFFALTSDTIAPTLRPLNFTPNTRPKTKKIRIKMQDNLSGIESYACFLNGSWILAEHDGKTASLTIDLTGKLRSGTNTLTVEATDAVGNTSHQKWTILQ